MINYGKLTVNEWFTSIMNESPHPQPPTLHRSPPPPPGRQIADAVAATAATATERAATATATARATGRRSEVGGGATPEAQRRRFSWLIDKKYG